MWHPAGVQCGTRCQVETSRNSHAAAGCNACIRLICDGYQAESWHHLQRAMLTASCRWREMGLTVVNQISCDLCIKVQVRTAPLGPQLRLGPGRFA